MEPALNQIAGIKHANTGHYDLIFIVTLFWVMNSCSFEFCNKYRQNVIQKVIYKFPQQIHILSGKTQKKN